MEKRTCFPQSNMGKLQKQERHTDFRNVREEEREGTEGGKQRGKERKAVEREGAKITSRIRQSRRF